MKMAKAKVGEDHFSDSIDKIQVKLLLSKQKSVGDCANITKCATEGDKKSKSKSSLQKSFIPGKKDKLACSPPKPKQSAKGKSIVLSKSNVTEKALLEEETVIGKRKTKESTDGDDEQTGKKQKLEELTKKKRRLERKKMKNNYELSMRAKKLWGTLRQAKCPKSKKLELSVELYGVIKGKVKELAVAHDSSRVIQSLITHGSDVIKESIFEELEDEFIFLMKSVYASKIVMKFLKEGAKKYKEHIVKLMYGKVTALMRHKIASKVVEYAYTDAATSDQKSNMVMEFYGPTYAVFKDDQVLTLDELLKRDPMQKEVILSHLKETLSVFIEKSLIRHSITHRVLHEYLLLCSPRDKTEIIESLRPYVVEILHTDSGASAAMQCVWHGTNKDRKTVIKSMKTHVAKICREQYGHNVLLAIFDNVDDTKLVIEVLLKEMMTSLVELCDDPNGRRVLIHILAPRKTTYFHPSMIDVLKQGDGNAASKKDVDMRIKELHTFASPHLVRVVAENMERFATSPAHYNLIRAVATHATGVSDLHKKFVELLNRPGIAKPPKIFDDNQTYLLLKHLVRVDGENFKNSKDASKFVDVLLSSMSDDDLVNWMTSNRGTFALLMLLETEIPEVVARVRDVVKPMKAELATKTFAGAQLLLKKA